MPALDRGRDAPGLSDARLRVVLRAMANETNLRILQALVQGGDYPSELARRLGLPRSLVNRRLVSMEKLGLLRSESVVDHHRRVKRYHVISRDIQLSVDVDSLLFEVGSVNDRHLASRLSRSKDDPAYNYLDHSRFGLREAVSAWVARTVGDEEEVRVFFHEDELPRSGHRRFVENLNLPKKGGRYLSIIRHDSLRDIGSMSWPQGRGDLEEEKPSNTRTRTLSSSGFHVCGQGNEEFVQALTQTLLTEKKTRQKKERRTSIGR